MNHFCKHVLLFAALAAACTAHADPIWDVQETEDSIDITLIPGPMQVVTQAEGVVVSAGKNSAVVNPGEPDMPVLVRVFKARPGRHARIASVSADSIMDQAAAVLPRSFETVETVADNEVRRVTVRNPDTEIYSVNEFWPAPQARVTEAAMGTNVYIRLAVYPVQYNPVTKTLRVAGKVRVRVSFDESDEGPPTDGR